MLARSTMQKALKLASPPPLLTVSKWADKERHLSRESSAEPGRWNTDRAPYQRGIMDAINEPGIEQIVIMSSSQVGKTELLLNMIGYHIHYDPSPILVVQPTIEMAKSFSKDRLSPMCRDSPALEGKISSKRTRDGDNTVLHKTFIGGGGHITLAGSNAPASLASRPIRILLGDEIDRWPESAGTEGDPLNIAKKRTSTFFNRKMIFVSTPGNKGESRIDLAYENSDQRHYHVPCPHCGEYQILKWENLKWSKSAEGKHLPHTAHYECDQCKKKFNEADKMAMLKAGRWIAEKPRGKIAGFQLSELYSPWKRWSEVVEDFLEAKDNGEMLKVWVNTSMGEPFEYKGNDIPDWKNLYFRREDYRIGSISKEVRLLTAGCDVQKDRLEVTVVGWCRKEAWVIDHVVIAGETSEDGVWHELDELLAVDYQHPCGDVLQIRKMAIDSGYNTNRVYEYVRSKHSHRVIAIKGRDNLDVPIAQPKRVEINLRGKTIKHGIKVWHVGVDLLKSDLYGRLKLPMPTDSEKAKGFPSGFIHFPMLAEDYFKQLTAETCVSKGAVNGRSRFSWKKIYPSNEALDCFVYNMACYYSLGAQRWGDDRWSSRSPQVSNL